MIENTAHSGNTKYDDKQVPLVSVLMPVFNTARFLFEALISIGSQTFQNFEFIVIDDGSTDGSTRILEAFAAGEPRMNLIARKNIGLIGTRNELLRAANGRLVAWMDSDDVSLPCRLEKQVNEFRRDPALVCLGSAAQCIDPEGNYLNVERYPLAHRDILIEQQSGGAMRFPTTMMQREFALVVGGFREPFKIGEDFDLLLRLSERGTMANVSEVLYLYRQHISSVCAALGPQWPIYRAEILGLARERLHGGKDRLQKGEVLTIASAPTEGRRQIEWRVYLDWAGHAYRNGSAMLAWKYLRLTLVRKPSAKAAWKLLFKTVALHLRLIKRR